MGISLLINSFINDELKFNHFKVTFSEICENFEAIHIKIRGSFKDRCIAYAKINCNKKIFTYQHFNDNDWLSTTYLIVRNIKSTSIFLYNEDHKLNCDIGTFSKIIDDFNTYKIDYMCYSFFKASKLSKYNILPLNPIQSKLLNSFIIDKDKLKIIGKISPGYFYISLIGIYSKKYICEILKKQNFEYKIHLPFLSKIISRLISIRRRFFYKYLNLILNKFKTNLYLYPINTPFNFEKIWYENINLKDARYGILNKELFINFDDDNGMYSESLIKRGLYPFNKDYFLNYLKNRNDLLAKFTIDLNKGELYDCTYFSTLSRINICPVLVINIIYGEIDIKSNNDNLIFKDNKNNIYIYSNLYPLIKAKENSKINISIFDEIAK